MDTVIGVPDLKTQLIRVAESADKVAFAALFRHFAPRIRNYGLRHLGSDANAMELVQETMLLVWQKARLYHPEKGAPSTWIYTVMRNQCFDMLRRRRASREDLCAEEIWPLLEFGADLPQGPGGEDAVLTRQMAHYVSVLPEPQQQVVRGIYLQELSQQELAERLGVPLGTIKSRLRLALQKLKEQVERHDA
ncbi:RNA polymerase sigma-70 factor (ECF subfamily) [Aeromonas sp. BIGb0405]|jgi:RNA polymerase sigma-70 factor, ECF subfamily|uniref:sigma-70 family RNA polymerase sigma factor n=1 Tax=Aeromonas TaxID=642 RepID=UPI001CCDBEB7|nr:MULTISPECIES: sigma-70 family RNA polymerase sigma factor [Aeromonas]MCS3457073.1 RNA polymerase sigma-70 factor (ECF subfamily) [Aeromonas sp. BIGb0405]MCS3460730.1 RNA polymerase sigma-70 factor (ECF subfamily) [Aeromonas sp. BIGb0445]UBO73846.1 sigma-70 family RNA polymerase sigma factor [Aeromonas rivuli]